jgi:hypothetical protein
MLGLTRSVSCCLHKQMCLMVATSQQMKSSTGLVVLTGSAC